MQIRYAKGPTVYLYERANLSKKTRQLLWGDWLRIGDDIDAEWSEITWGQEVMAIKKSDYQEERLCELIFLDVGQGDGCILTTPVRPTGSEQIVIIDAGVGDNMDRYLKWRFRDFKTAFRFHAAVVTHPDKDHYYGFQDIFENEQVSFDVVYHNGLLERTGDDLLGPLEDGLLTDIRVTKGEAHALYSDDAVRGGKRYPKLLWTALNSDRFDDVRMLSTEHGEQVDGRTWMPGFAPSDTNDFTIEVLGPVVERTPNGTPGLRPFGDKLTSTAMDDGKTKNGHSVLLKLCYRDVSILFGGDLNTPAEHFLVRHYGNGGEAPQTISETRAMIEAARERFAVDVMKTCHHGASDVSEEFLDATHAAAFVVSSGDNEGYVHPRPDLLGLLGSKGSGTRPLILSTELARSTREREDPRLRKRLDALEAALDEVADDEAREVLNAERTELLDQIFKRNVGVYGAINVRTDGHTIVIAFRYERANGVKRWFTYELVPDATGALRLRDT